MNQEALKSLMNMPQPSEKLARWGMAIQEFDITIHHRAGRCNGNADALSRFPLETTGEGVSEAEGVVATVAIETESDLVTLQRQDQDLGLVIHYLETGVLPTGEKVAKELALSKSQYILQDEVLYQVQPDCTLRIIPPCKHRRELYHQAHDGQFGAHIGDGQTGNHTHLSNVLTHNWNSKYDPYLLCSAPSWAVFFSTRFTYFTYRRFGGGAAEQRN